MKKNSHFQSSPNQNCLPSFLASGSQLAVSPRCEGVFPYLQNPLDFLKGKIKTNVSGKSLLGMAQLPATCSGQANSATTTCRMMGGMRRLCDAGGWARGPKAEGRSRPEAQTGRSGRHFEECDKLEFSALGADFLGG